MELFYARMSMRGVSGAGREAYQHANSMPFGVGRQQLAFDPGRNLYPVRLEPLLRQRQHRLLAGLLANAKREPCLQRCTWTTHIGGPGDEPIEHRTEALHFALTVRARRDMGFGHGNLARRHCLSHVGARNFAVLAGVLGELTRSEEHTSELQSRFGISYAVFC